MFACAVVRRSQCVLRLRKAALLVCSIVSTGTIVSSAAEAGCTLAGPAGPGGEEFFGFLAATSSAATSTVTAMNAGFQTQTGAFVASPDGSQPDHFAGGVWGRAVGGRLDTESMSEGTRIRPAAPQGPFATACSTKTRNDFTGFQGGIDVGRLDFGATGWNGHFGMTGGHFETEATSPHGSGVTRSQVPFIGVYAALQGRAGFFMDGQVAAQFYNLDVSEPSIGAQGSMNGAGIGILSSTGYRWNLGHYFIEPSAGVVYSRVHLDPLNISPTVLGTGMRVVTVPTVLTLGDIETFPARIGIRVGTSFVTGRVSLAPFAAVSVWHEFAGNTTMGTTFTLPTPQTGATPSLNLSSTRIGTFGQYSLGISANVLDTGWLGYARVDYRNGENIESVSINGGIRYQFAPAPQVSPPSTPRRSAKAPEATFSQRWTGFYVGGFAGGAWTGDVTATELAPGPGGSPFFNGIGTQTSYGLGSSGIAGLALGYNYQMGTVVAGLEAEGGYLRLAGAAPFSVSPETVSSARIGDWYALLAGRFGFSAGPALIYGKAGAALVNVTDNVIDDCMAVPPCTGPSRVMSAAGGNSVGVMWVAGAGLEYALTTNWSVKGEYLAMGTDGSNVASGPRSRRPPHCSPDVQLASRHTGR